MLKYMFMSLADLVLHIFALGDLLILEMQILKWAIFFLVIVADQL
jgi:hypothetical protein